MLKRLGFAALLLVVGLAPAVQAGPITYNISFVIDASSSGVGILNADDPLVAGEYGVVSGSLTVTGGLAAGDYSLLPNPAPWGSFYSPSGAFIVDNRIYYPSNPVFNGNGLLFLKDPGGVGARELNLWGNGDATAFYYTLYSSLPETGGYDVAVGTIESLTITPVPDPGSSLLLMGMALAGLVWKRKS